MTFCKEARGRARPRTSRWKTGWRCVSTLGLAVILLGMVSVPANAHVRVFLGFGLPVYPYAYSYPPPPPYYPYPPYVVYGPSVGFATPVPPGCVTGHWGWRHGPWGYRSRVWVPPHRR
jgi:hypothetical protein